MVHGRVASWVAALSALLICHPSAANEVQYNFCTTGYALGQAATRFELFGEARGAIPDDQKADIAANLAGASTAIDSAEALMGSLFRSPGRANSINQLQRDLEGLDVVFGDWRANAAQVRSIYNRYLSSTAGTFVSTRLDDVQADGQCDTQILRACFHYGEAAILSTGESMAWARSRRLTAQSNMGQAVRNGLAIAVDSAPDQRSPAIKCCSMGDRADWDGLMAALRDESAAPTARYANIGLRNTLFGIVADAQLKPGACGGTPLTKPPCSGRWRWQAYCPERSYSGEFSVDGTADCRAFRGRFGANSADTLAGGVSGLGLSFTREFQGGGRTLRQVWRGRLEGDRIVDGTVERADEVKAGFQRGDCTWQAERVGEGGGFASNGWRALGTMNRFCSAELVCGTGDQPVADERIPACVPGRSPRFIQDRRAWNGCIAQQCDRPCEGSNCNWGNERSFPTYECR